MASSDLKKLFEVLKGFVQYVEDIRKNIREIMPEIENNFTKIRDKYEAYNISKKAQIPTSILNEHTNLSERLLHNLNRFIMDEMSEITFRLDELSSYSTNLEKKFYEIERSMMNIDWNIHISFRNIFLKYFKWCDSCWKYLHILCHITHGTLSGITTINQHSNIDLSFSSTVEGVKLEDVFENPIISLLPLLKRDIFSRQQIENDIFIPVMKTEKKLIM